MVMATGRVNCGSDVDEHCNDWAATVAYGCAPRTWSMACFLWTAPDRVAQLADRSKRGRAWAKEAASFQETDPVRLEQEMRVFKLAWESKRQPAYARWLRAEWSLSQWWVEQKKEDATRNRSKGAGFSRNRRGDG
jgi:hypothetical protein